MGTNKSSETVTLAEHLRSQRTMTAAEVDAAAERHGVPARYASPHQGARAAIPSAH